MLIVFKAVVAPGNLHKLIAEGSVIYACMTRPSDFRTVKSIEIDKPDLHAYISDHRYPYWDLVPVNSTSMRLTLQWVQSRILI